MRISLLLGEFDARSKELNKLQTIVKGLKAQVAEIEVGTYGEWIRTAGTARNMLDQRAVVADYAARGLEPPMMLTKAPVQVTHVAGP
jgi:hypothetical protein